MRIILKSMSGATGRQVRQGVRRDRKIKVDMGNRGSSKTCYGGHDPVTQNTYELDAPQI